MSEWLPALSGVVLGTAHLRFARASRTLVWLALAVAVLATVISGEWRTAPQLVVVDAALVAAGIAASRLAHRCIAQRDVAHRGWLARRGPVPRARHMSG